MQISPREVIPELPDNDTFEPIRPRCSTCGSSNPSEKLARQLKEIIQDELNMFTLLNGWVYMSIGKGIQMPKP